MPQVTDVQELKTGLIIFRRTDVQHRNWYCRVKVPTESRYKTIALKTSDVHEARDRAFDHDADIRFRVKHEVPIFDKSFAEVATEYSAFQKRVATTGKITMNRWKIVDSYIRLHLIPYVGNIQITLIGQEKWDDYEIWRKQNNHEKQKKHRPGFRPPRKVIAAAGPNGAAPPSPAKDGTIRQEMMTFRAIMKFAAKKKYIGTSQVPEGKLPTDKARRDAFKPQEYRHLHTVARRWIKEAKSDWNGWYRKMAYNFMLVMTNTGMRPIEAGNLRWRDIDARTDKQGRQVTCLDVRGKGKFRELVAAQNVASYLERIKSISKATKPDDFVFTTHTGEPASTLYDSLIESLLTESGLLYGSTGSRRSTYCFRHTYATFRLLMGVDVYNLAKQMGTSVQMIEQYYGHITPADNADRILQGMSVWESVADDSGEPPAA